MVTRRRLLLGGGSLGMMGAGAALGVPSLRHRLRDALDPVAEPPHPVPTGPVGEVVSGSFRSAAMGTTTGWSLAHPHGVRPGTALPLLLVLHGRGNSHQDVLGSHRLGAFLAETVRSGVPPFAVAGVDGGDHSYWHARSSGEDPQRMILDELLPLLGRRGLRTDRLALGGWSMGGYGALLLAPRLGRSRVAALAVDSPALWSRWKDSAAGAFDGPADFAAHDVLAATAALAGIPVRVSCGTSDPFLPGVEALLRALPACGRDLGPGAHTLGWWQHAAPAQLAFVGHALAT